MDNKIPLHRFFHGDNAVSSRVKKYELLIIANAKGGDQLPRFIKFQKKNGSQCPALILVFLSLIQLRLPNIIARISNDKSSSRTEISTSCRHTLANAR